ncbi:uncharacterized protein BDZ99DRAFT_563641 [Mytilinidion resinicola]|uniref:Uncharacterized protein n=1 Tax=Mytilinidion resinicola TaxID=574789 RepID=A0A6A6YPP6_9PEZI|nr:uncharacterized protein BDZ99DRAFT_563641 [Mytilinidion resinicola]KAF2810498.1 hypothetical protein BDZ99DRAFT_563641 [Mytilinidion resinicola]
MGAWLDEARGAEAPDSLRRSTPSSALLPGDSSASVSLCSSCCPCFDDRGEHTQSVPGSRVAVAVLQSCTVRVLLPRRRGASVVRCLRSAASLPLANASEYRADMVLLGARKTGNQTDNNGSRDAAADTELNPLAQPFVPLPQICAEARQEFQDPYQAFFAPAQSQDQLYGPVVLPPAYPHTPPFYSYTDVEPQQLQLNYQLEPQTYVQPAFPTTMMPHGHQQAGFLPQPQPLTLGQLQPHDPFQPPARNVLPMPYLDVTAYDDLTGKGIPSLTDALNYSPFRDFAAEKRPKQYGVIRIENAPYATMRNEVLSLLGKTARVVEYPPGSSNYAVHTTFDRLSGKAYNTFVEVNTEAEAQRLVRGFGKYLDSHKHGRKLGNRPIYVHLSNQTELMESIFPRVKCVQWNGTDPLIQPPGPGESGFDAFLHEEELRGMMRFAEKPGRTQFCKDCPQRVYEAMTTLLQKFPWGAQHLYTLRERNMLFAYLNQLVEIFVEKLPRLSPELVNKLTPQLLGNMVQTACSCGGFSSGQQARLVVSCGGVLDLGVNLHPLAGAVPFQVLSIAYDRVQGPQKALVDWYVVVIRTATGLPGALAPEVHEWANNQYRGIFPGSTFGWYATPASYQAQLGMTMAELATLEASEFQRLVGLVLEAGRLHPDLVPLAPAAPAA